MSELTGYLDVWFNAVDDFVGVLEALPDSAWQLPTDLPGWDVHAVVAHVAHLESLLAGGEHEEVPVPEAPHVRNPMGTFTEQGVVARRGLTPAELIGEIRASTSARHAALLADPPSDPDAPAPGVFGALGWSTRTLLRNRPLDVWMHGQDVRRAVGLQGGMDLPVAAHVTDVLLEALPVVVAKRAGLPPGTSVVVEVRGHAPAAAEVGADGRGSLLSEVPAEPTVRLRLDREAYTRLSAGRSRPEGGVEMSGDADLGMRLLESMAITP
mgnify:CR=1 FL=1